MLTVLNIALVRKEKMDIKHRGPPTEIKIKKFLKADISIRLPNWFSTGSGLK